MPCIKSQARSEIPHVIQAPPFQHTVARVQWEVEQGSVTKGNQQVAQPFKHGHQDGARDDLCNKSRHGQDCTVIHYLAGQWVLHCVLTFQRLPGAAGETVSLLWPGRCHNTLWLHSNAVMSRIVIDYRDYLQPSQAPCINSIHPPEMEINPLKRVCGCPCGGVIKGNKIFFYLRPIRYLEAHVGWPQKSPPSYTSLFRL